MDLSATPVSISPPTLIEQDKRLAHFPRNTITRFRCEPSGEEGIYRYGIDRKKFLHYIRVGKWWFFDSAFFEEDSPSISAIGKENIIWMVKSSVGEKPLHWSHHPYTASMLYALTLLDVKGKTILDLGCGNGLLGILALKLGASKVFGIDNDGNMKDQFMENAKLNGFSGKVEFLPFDISAPDLWMGKFKMESVDIVFGNIGPHYSQTDILAINLLGKFPRATTFVGGGYVHPGLSAHHSLSPSRAYGELKRQGFSVSFEVFEMVVKADGGEKRNRLSFVACKEDR